MADFKLSTVGDVREAYLERLEEISEALERANISPSGYTSSALIMLGLGMMAEAGVPLETALKVLTVQAEALLKRTN